MQYIIKSRLITAGGYNYDITEENGTPVCRFNAEFSALNRGNLFDMAGHPLVHVEQRVLSLASEFDITVAGQEPTVVKKQSINPLHSIFTIEGPFGSYQLEGDWKRGNYSIQKEGQVAARVSFQLAGLQSVFTVDVVEGADVSLLLCLVIVMEEENDQPLVL